MGWLGKRGKRPDKAAVHGDIGELVQWHQGLRAELEARGCKTVMGEASRNDEEGAMLIFTAPLRQGHVIVWNNGWIETFVFRTADREPLLSGTSPPDDDEPLGALLDSIVELLLA